MPVVLGKRAGRGALKLFKHPARFERRLVSQGRVRPEQVQEGFDDRLLVHRFKGFAGQDHA
ncbi:hypothetical protein [Stappia sp. 28M-7]|uniref:hypothetical protein n=1 Tax=Stappia sp. 28M-7 TaxID=2762596 RepID=UPI00163C8F1F|nr:hypothetical protein [Stappia sp. 28M-7]MBC2860957.1 hypothetical protein [Stappia sp. 28M-7]